MTIWLDEDEFEINGDYTYQCPYYKAVTDVSTTSGIPQPNDTFECRVCEKKIVVLNREVNLFVEKAKNLQD